VLVGEFLQRRVSPSLTVIVQRSPRALPPDQKLAIVTQLWDDLAASSPLTLPADELAEMHHRRDELLADRAIAMDRRKLPSIHRRKVRWQTLNRRNATGGAFDHLNRKIELIYGEIREMNPAGPVHDDLIA